MAGCSIREEGLRAAALPGRVAAADAVALDAGPRAHERVGHIYQSVFGVALREQIFLRWKCEPGLEAERPLRSRPKNKDDDNGPKKQTRHVY